MSTRFNSQVNGEGEAAGGQAHGSIGHNSAQIDFEEQRLKNELSFQLLNRTHVLERALEHLVQGKIRKAHAWILRTMVRSLDPAGGVVALDRDEICADLGITRETLRKRIHELRALGYIKGETTETGKMTSRFVLGDAAIDHERIMADYISAIGKFCDDKRAENRPQERDGTVPNSGTTVPNIGTEPYPELGQPYPELGQNRTQNWDKQPTDKDPTLYRRDNTIPNGIVCADGADFFGGVPKVIVRDRTHYANGDKIAFKPAGAKRQTDVTLNFLRGIAGPQYSDEDLLDYAAWVAHALYNGALPEKLKNGETRTVFNHISGSFKIWDEKQAFTAFEQWRRGRAQKPKNAADTAGVLPITPFDWDED